MPNNLRVLVQTVIYFHLGKDIDVHAAPDCRQHSALSTQHSALSTQHHPHSKMKLEHEAPLGMHVGMCMGGHVPYVCSSEVMLVNLRLSY